MPDLLRLSAERFERVQVTDWDVLDLIKRLDAPGVLIFIDPPYINESRPRSTGASSGYVKDEFDHEDLMAAMLGAKHASFAVTHYPHEFYDAEMTFAGDYASHRNIPNGEGRSVKAERLYLLDRSGVPMVIPATNVPDDEKAEGVCPAGGPHSDGWWEAEDVACAACGWV